MNYQGPGPAVAPRRGFHRLAARRASARTADPAVVEQQDAGPPVAEEPRTTSPLAGGVNLGRLLDIARLSPAQAMTVGFDLLADLAAADADGSSRNGERPQHLHRDTVVVGADGRTRPPTGGPAGRTGAPAILDELAAATGEPVVAELVEAAAALRRPSGDVALVAARLGAAVADPEATRDELAQLVAAVDGQAAPAPPPLSPELGPAPPVPPRPSLRARGRRVVAHTWKALLTLVVLAVLVAVEVVLLDDRIAEDINTVLDAGRSAPGTTAPTQEPTAPAPAPPPEPPAAGAVTGVDARTIGSCGPEATCRVRVAVLLVPEAQPRTVEWFLRAVDRCTGATTTLPGGRLDLPPDATRADAVQTVTLPAGQAPALTAVTTLPAIAASPPLAVPATATCEPPPPTGTEGG